VSGQIQAKALKAIAVTSPARYPSLPEVPTFAESGLPGYDVTSWYGLAMAPDTPRPIVDKLNKAVAEALNRPAVRKQISDIGAQPKTSTPEELSRHIAAEVAKWQGVREKAGIRSFSRVGQAGAVARHSRRSRARNAASGRSNSGPATKFQDQTNRQDRQWRTL
jgi:hypothetical protein